MLQFQRNGVYEFLYHDKPRRVLVDRVLTTYVVGVEEKANDFRSFNFNKIQGEVKQVASPVPSN